MNHTLGSRKQCRKKKSGQAVIEYLVVTLMIVGVASAAYIAIRNRIKGPLGAIKAKIEGRPGDPTRKPAGSGAKNYQEYYQNVEIKAK